MEWSTRSIVLSVALTIVLDLAVRAFPGARDGAARGLDDLAAVGRSATTRHGACGCGSRGRRC